MDAIDLVYETLVCGLLDGETDTTGYPEYNAIVGGVVSHWDEVTGDMIVRAVVGWGGKGVRGDTDRNAARLLAGLFNNVTADTHAIGTVSVERPIHGHEPWRTGLRPLRVRLRARTGLLLPQVRHADAARLTGAPGGHVPFYDYVCANCGHEMEVMHSVHGHGPAACPKCDGTMKKAISAPAVHFKGSGWARKERRRRTRPSRGERARSRARPSGSDAVRRSEPRRGVSSKDPD